MADNPSRPRQDAAIAQSWDVNAHAWAKAVRAGDISSRAVTDAAILEAVQGLGPARALDAGCGEGWLTAALNEIGVETVGFDASQDLVALARAAYPALGFHTLDYEALAETAPDLGGPFDVAVCNFSLFAEDLSSALTGLRAQLRPGGHLVVQSLHPETAGPPFTDGWRVESFSAFGGGDWAPMPWYYRTRRSWLAALASAGFHLKETREPRAAGSAQPSSILFIAQNAP